MEYTEEHRKMKSAVVKFIESEVNPHVAEWEEAGIFPAHELFKKMGDLGFLGVNKPEEFGGMGLDYSYQAMTIEALGACSCGGVPMAIGVQTDMATPALSRFGSDELRRDYLAPAIAGDMVACVGVSEAHAGSDVANIKSNAVKDGDDYIINGSKMWITNSTQANFMCMLVNTSDGHKHQNKSLIVVPMDTPGITKSERLNKLGQRSSDTAQIFLDDVRIPQRNLIGTEGAGFMYQMLQFQEERLWCSLSLVDGMDRIIQLTEDYCRERGAFNQSILDFQVVHFRLAELRTEVELLRALSEKCVEAMVRGENVTRLASMAKLKAGRLSRELADACLQYWGGMGYMWDSPVSQFLRDSRLTSIGGGADEVMLSIISKLDGTLPSPKKKKRDVQNEAAE
ncbi:acyl-CoA dehydrogenase family protein [Pseudovibrio sp. Tun.PSC04-5.I4]|uniref:acyl-CoA dehydrogenase family protein n=1 Tax=Pseudovibrio sp. Tun.PSC04-5.I4 TaxID=1798213 RepID=UPI000883410C|nr:acyl-CoA dehydrogenase family protein [Pseudovibrio sp. Tun.PSC04-5.I4]SDR33379.1 citronellyl-CoA dehydrogenase [Pseudovibrio sp. Tun.PSC04-5.I4]